MGASGCIGAPVYLVERSLSLDNLTFAIDWIAAAFAIGRDAPARRRAMPGRASRERLRRRARGCKAASMISCRVAYERSFRRPSLPCARSTRTTPNAAIRIVSLPTRERRAACERTGRRVP
jgi:hypothetical protein